MIVRVEDWDGQPAIRLPDEIVKEMSLKEGSEVEVIFSNDHMSIERPRRQQLRLEDLLAGITPENLHGEWDIGPPVGREILEPYEPSETLQHPQKG